MSDTIETFLGAGTAQRLRMAADAVLAGELRALLGEAGLAACRQLAGGLDQAHLSIAHAPNLVFVPGITGSLLRSRTKGGVWWIDLRSRAHLEDLRLRPDGLTDWTPEDAIVPFAVDTAYEPFLAAVLARDDFGHEVFPYDWRKPLAASTAALRRLVRTCAEENGGQPVHLVAHSLGGLLVRATLMRHDDLWDQVGRVVFVGTPHYGSPAMGGYLKHHFWGFEAMALLGKYLSRDAFRSMWGALGLLPAPRGVYPGTRAGDRDPWPDAAGPYPHPCANFDLHDARAWDLGLPDDPTQALQQVLDAAAQQQRDLDAWHARLAPARRERLLMIAGVGYRSLFRLEYRDRALGLWEQMVKVTAREPGDPHREGDGRVPLASACLPDIETRFVRGVHGGLTNIPAVCDEVFGWLNGRAPRLPDDPAQALAPHLAAEDSVSRAPVLDGTDRADAFGDDPGFLEARAIDDARLAELEAALEAGQLPQFQYLKLL